MLALLVVLLLQDPARALVDRLESDAVEEREGAAKALRDLGAAALPALRAAVRDRTGEVAARAAAVLRAIEVRLLVPDSLRKLYPDLERELERGDESVWGSIVLDILHDPDPDLEALPSRDRALVYEQALRSAATERHRKDVLQALVEQPARPDPVGVAALLTDANSEIRALAARALGGMHPAAGVEPLRKALQDREENVRYQAARSLGRLKAKEARPDLEALLAHPVPVSTAAARALGQAGVKEAEASLRKLLAEPGALRLAAAQALADLEVEGGDLPLARILAEGEFADQVEAADHFADRGGKGVPALKRCLKDGNAHGRALAVAALAEAGGAEQVADAAALLGDVEGDVREAAIRALGALDARGIAERIAPLLADREWKVRAAAAEVLGCFQAEGAAERLRGLLRDDAPYVRIAAAEALCRLGDAAGAPVLLKEARERHRLVQQVIPLSALNALRDRAVWDRLSGRRVEGTLEGRTPGVLQRLGATARMAVKEPEDDAANDPADAPWRMRRHSIRGTSVLEALLAMRGPYDFILGTDSIRFVPHEEALDFWALWLSQRPGK
jgi:HEAT repeat protein